MHTCLTENWKSQYLSFPSLFAYLPLNHTRMRDHRSNLQWARTQKMLLSSNCTSHTMDLDSKSEFKTDLKFEVTPKPALSGQTLAFHVPAEKLKASISSLRCQAKGRKPFSFSAGVHVDWGTAVRWEHHITCLASRCSASSCIFPCS